MLSEVNGLRGLWPSSLISIFIFTLLLHDKIVPLFLISMECTGHTSVLTTTKTEVCLPGFHSFSHS